MFLASGWVIEAGFVRSVGRWERSRLREVFLSTGRGDLVFFRQACLWLMWGELANPAWL